VWVRSKLAFTGAHAIHKVRCLLRTVRSRDLIPVTFHERAPWVSDDLRPTCAGQLPYRRAGRRVVCAVRRSCALYAR